MADAIPLDGNWLRANPVPAPDPDADKNARGRVLAIGGGARVPGGLLLTGEAALRAGAGKLQMATVEAATLAIGIALPEASVIPLPAGADGELAEVPGLAEAVERCDALVAGPAMTGEAAALAVLDAVLETPGWDGMAILDAGVLMVAAQRAGAIRALARTPVMTPHIGEIAAMLDLPADEINADRAAALRRAARLFGAVVVLKGSTTLVAGPDGDLLAFAGGGVGLATGGSGDVLAGIAAGLAARGATPLAAAGWAVWLHGEAGRRCAERIGPVGFLSRELLALVPALMTGV